MATTKSVSDIDKVFEPVRALNKLTLDNTAKLVELNLAVAKRFADATLANVREAVELKDPAAVQAYLAKQPEAMKALADEARAPCQTF